MRYLSVCSGIEAATAAWHPLGWEAAAFSEIEKFPRAVLRHHYPDTPLHGDFTTIGANEYGPIDLLVGGTPCQSFSIAGLRGGLADDRGNLALEFLRLADRTRPSWVVWENVPGVLSSNGGRDFGSILGGLVELGYGFAYRVLDAQHFGVPQRRRRVFVVGHIGSWTRAAAVLFERHSLQGHPAPRRETGQGIARDTAVGTLSCNTGPNGHDAGNFACNQAVDAGHLIASTGETSHCLNAGGMGRQDYETETLIAHSLRGEGFDAREDGTGRGTPLVPVAYRTSPNCGAWETGDRTDALTTSTDPTSHVVAFQTSQSGVREVAAHATLDSNNGSRRHNGVVQGSAVRRLTPRECEALQGFPSDYTLIPWRGKSAADCPDGPRYKALGNSMAVPCMVWIGQRIEAVDTLGAAVRRNRKGRLSCVGG